MADDPSGPRPNVAAMLRTGAAQALSGGRGHQLSANAQAKLRSLSWRNQYRLAAAYPYSFQGDGPLAGALLEIAQQRKGEQRGIGTGAVVWDGAVVLMKYLEKREAAAAAAAAPPLVAGRSVIELGAGTGAVGLVAAALGARSVAITDVEEILFLTRENVVAAQQQLGPPLAAAAVAVRVAALPPLAQRVRTFSYRWGEESVQLRAGAPYDVVLVAECIVPRLYPIEPLAAALAQLLPPGGTAQALVAYEHRHHVEFHPAERFQELLAARGLDLWVIPAAHHDPEYTLEDVELWCVTRRDSPPAALAAATRGFYLRGTEPDDGGDGGCGGSVAGSGGGAAGRGASDAGAAGVRARAPLSGAAAAAARQAARQAAREKEDRLRALLGAVWPGRQSAVIKGLQKLARCGVASVEQLRDALGPSLGVTASGRGGVDSGTAAIAATAAVAAVPDIGEVPINTRLRGAGFKIFGTASLAKMVQWLAADTAAAAAAAASAAASVSTAPVVTSVTDAMAACFGSSSDDDDDDSGGGVGDNGAGDGRPPATSVADAVQACFGGSSDGDSDGESDGESDEGGVTRAPRAGNSCEKNSAGAGGIGASTPAGAARPFASTVGAVLRSMVDLRSAWLKVQVVAVYEAADAAAALPLIAAAVAAAGPVQPNVDVLHVVAAPVQKADGTAAAAAAAAATAATRQHVLAVAPYGCDVLLDLRRHDSGSSEGGIGVAAEERAAVASVDVFGNLYGACLVPGGTLISALVEQFKSPRTPMSPAHYYWALHACTPVQGGFAAVRRRSALGNPLWPLREAPPGFVAAGGSDTATRGPPLIPRRRRVTPTVPVAVFKDVERVGTTHGTGVELPPGTDAAVFADVLAARSPSGPASSSRSPSPLSAAATAPPATPGWRFWERPEEVTEMAALEAVTVARSAGERRAGRLSRASLQRAAAALRDYGVCVLRAAFDEDSVRGLAEEGRRDLRVLEQRLREHHGIDLREPSRSTSFNNNFAELAMREPRRCDVHRSPRLLAENMRMRAAARAAAAAAADAPDADNSCNSGTAAAAAAAAAARDDDAADAAASTGTARPAATPPVTHAHPDVLAVLQAVCSPPGGARSAGNWGRWNFGGPGPRAPPDPLVAGDAGVIFSFPGAADQSFHADTPHLYEHLHLPPHYVDLFMPATEDAAAAAPADGTNDNDSGGVGDSGGASAAAPGRVVSLSPAAFALDVEPCLRTFKVGQTAFISGSHRLDCSARVCYFDTSTVARKEFDDRTICPHLRTGDALLFDTRTLHFGLGNLKNTSGSSNDGGGLPVPAAAAAGPDHTRSLLYINYWQPWWDKDKDKNWGEVELCTAAERAAAVAGVQQRMLQFPP